MYCGVDRRSYGLEAKDYSYTETTEVHEICCVLFHLQAEVEDVRRNALLSLFAQLVRLSPRPILIPLATRSASTLASGF